MVLHRNAAAEKFGVRFISGRCMHSRHLNPTRLNEEYIAPQWVSLIIQTFQSLSPSVIVLVEDILMLEDQMATEGTNSTIALVTGANKGLGLETSRQLASPPYNYHVLMASRDASRGEAATSFLHSQGLSVEHILLDVTDDESIVEAASFVNEKYGHIDVLVNNAGILIEHLC